MGDTVLIENPTPLVNGGKIGDEIASLQALEEKAKKAQEAFEKEEKLRKELEELNAKLLSEKTNLQRQLEGEKGSLSDFQEKALKLNAQKADLESQLQVRISFILSLDIFKHLFTLNVAISKVFVKIYLLICQPDKFFSIYYYTKKFMLKVCFSPCKSLKCIYLLGRNEKYSR